jgi:hypothetical protein
VLDACGPGFTLIGAAGAGDWERQAATASAALGVPLTRFSLGRDGVPEDPAAFEARFGIGSAGAVLVRPDGHVAWRAAGPPALGRPGLDAVLRAILGRAGD